MCLHAELGTDTKGAGAPDQPADESQHQKLQEKPKAKRPLLSAQQIGYRPGTVPSSPRMLPAWV